MYALSKSGEVEKAYQLLQKEVARGAPPTLARVYGSVINRLTRIGRISEALEALSWSHSFSAPDIKSYHALLFCMSRPLPSLAHSPFPLLPSSSYIITDYRKKLDVASAFRLYGQLKVRRLVPDIIVFCELLHTLAHDDPRVEMLFGDMRTYDIPPSVIAHNIVMAGEGRAGDVGAVRARFAVMQSQNLMPNSSSYIALISAHKARRDPVGAQAVITEMQREGLKADT